MAYQDPFQGVPVKAGIAGMNITSSEKICRIYCVSIYNIDTSYIYNLIVIYIYNSIVYLYIYYRDGSAAVGPWSFSV